MTGKDYGKLLSLLGVAALSVQVMAESYMTDEQAVKVIFPGKKLRHVQLTLDDSQVALIEKKSDEKVRNKTIVAWVASDKSCVFIDQVLGKHEFIKYAVGVEAAGTVKAIEILEYRESYGQQVREEPWRKQFVGKTLTDPLKVNKDIKNISGATLSSVHVTGGVHRILFTYDVIKDSLEKSATVSWNLLPNSTVL